MRLDRLLSSVLLAVVLTASSARAQQSYGTDFDSFPSFIFAEQLNVPGVTFSSNPVNSWVTAPSFFQDLTGQVLFQPTGEAGTLDVVFPAIRSVSLTFAMNALVGQSSVVVQAIEGSTVVAQVTQVTVVSDQGSFGEGVVTLASSTPFHKVRISSLPADVEIAIDNLFGYTDTVCVAPTRAPVIRTSASTTVVAGRSFTLDWDPAFGLATGGSYVVETAFSPSFSSVDATYSTFETFAIIPVSSTSAGRTLYTRVRAVQACGAAGPNSSAVGFTVSAAAASFEVTTAAAALTTSIGKLPPAGSVAFRNTGGTSGTLSLSVTGGLQLDRPSLALAPGQVGTVSVSATSVLVANAGSVKGTLTGTYGNDKVTVPVSLTVTGAATTDRTGTRVAPSLATVSFSAPSGQNPAPRTVLLAVGPITGTGSVYLVPSVGPGGAWLDLSGDFTRPISAPGTVSLTLSVNRSARSAGDGAASSYRTLVKVKADGASDDDAAVIEVVDYEPGTVVSGTDRLLPEGRVPNAAQGWGRSRQALAAVPPPDGTSFIVPSAVKAVGNAGAQFSSDGWLKNLGSTPVSATFYFTPDGKNGLTDPSVLKATRSLPAGTTFRLSELLPSIFGVADTSGQVEIRSAGASSLTLRTAVESVTGGDATSRYGTEIPTVSYGSGVGLGGGELVIPGIDEDDANRSNVILAETTGNEATAKITITTASGQEIGTTSITIPPYGKKQINALIKTVFGQAATLTGGWAGLTVTAGAGKVAAIATVIDNKSNSFSAIKGRAPGITTTVSGRTEPLAVTAAASLVVPSAARLTGAFNTQYTTSLTMVNGTATNAILSLTYNYIDVNDGSKAKSVTKNVTLPPRGALAKSLGKDVVSDLFGIKVPSYGWMKLDGDVTRIVALSAISALVDANDASKGVKTSQVDGVLTSSPDVMGKQELERRFSGAEKSVQRRTNVIFVEVTGQPCDVLLSLNGPTGNPLAQKTVSVTGNQYLQINDVFGPNGLDLGDGPFQNMEVTARVLSGDGRVIGVATVIDNVSRNPEVWVMKPAGTPTPSLGF